MTVMKSMTGYGKAKCAEDNRELTIELKSVNNRFLDINLRTPKVLSFADDIIRKAIQSRLKRGTVDVYISYEDKSDSGKTVEIDLPLAAAYVAAAKKLRTEFLLDEDFNVTALMRTPEVAKAETAPADIGLLERLVRTAVNGALNALEEMRLAEGNSLKLELETLINEIKSMTANVEQRAPLIVQEYREKLVLRIGELLTGVPYDEARLINEVAFFADKADIREEITRLKSHVNQFLDITAQDGEQGRKLDFLVQEINRETNTIGSKSNDLSLTNTVVNMKNTVEKLREQIRNIE